jgi:hypothetical protein
MFTESNRVLTYAHLGDVWLRDQKARILQRQLQLGGRLRIDIDSLLSRAALLRQVEPPRRESRGDLMRRATVDAIEHCLRLEAVVTTAVVEPNLA